MAPAIPSSLSPHIAVLVSPDLEDLLESSSLPPLPHILQSFSPLPGVTTRTTSLVSVPHSSFALRFSDIFDIEQACREDDEQRAVRTIDWITARVNKRCAKWVYDVDNFVDKDAVRTPWWDELRRCVEGDFVPSKSEAWNHPVALILAVSTAAPNPLQAITALHSRGVQLPPWVDSNYLKYTLIIHPQNSPLSDEEAIALYNAVKKQFGLHSYLLSLTLPKSPPPPFPVPALMPRLPPPPLPDSPPHKNVSSPTAPVSPTTPTTLNTLRMEEKDVQQTAKFTREFVVMSLVPWMEKCVVEWNETFSSTRRLPSRLFTSTRRLFGSQSPSPTPSSISSSVQSFPGRSNSDISLPNGGPVPPPQQRRLAEFATILGDFKLAVTIWEALRKESKGGSDILPLLLTPSPTIPLHASTALTSIHPTLTEHSPHAQIRALLCAVRWEAGIATPNFLGSVLEGERWMVWAAGNAEEAPSALLLAQAALLSARKQSRRRAALWYVSAATRLEKCGIKPLTMYFLRKARELHTVRPTKELSPSFWYSENKSPVNAEGLEDIFSGIEHPLGRLLYTTGDVTGAVKLFLGLLRGSSTFSAHANVLADTTLKLTGNDKLYLDDFRVAFIYLKSSGADASNYVLESPVKLCNPRQSRLRFPGDSENDGAGVWSARQESWQSFWKSRGERGGIMAGGKVSIEELFWVDLVLDNPLEAEVGLSNLTLVVRPSMSSSEEFPEDLVEVEIIKEVTLGPKQSITVPIALKSRLPAKLNITHVKYEFLSLLPSIEPLAYPGRRLHDTPLQRQQRTYTPDVQMQVEIVPADYRLLVSFVEDERLVVVQGENKVARLWLTNAGSRPIGEIWMVTGTDDEVWLGSGFDSQDAEDTHEIFHSPNSLRPQEPYPLTWSSSDQSPVLLPGSSVEVPIVLHAEEVGHNELYWFFVFREDNSHSFHSAKLSRTCEVRPLLDISVTAQPSNVEGYFYTLDVDLTNVSLSNEVNLTQLTCISPLWTFNPLADSNFGTLSPSQCSRFLLGGSQWFEGHGAQEANEFVAKKLRDVLQANDTGASNPPPIELNCRHIGKSPKKRSVQDAAILKFIQSGRRRFMSRHISQTHSYIPSDSHPYIFPLYNPTSVDLVLFWEIPSQRRIGHINVHGIMLGAGHARLDKIIEETETAKVKRSMYAETRRENMEVLDAIRASEWNAEMDPIVISLLDSESTTHDFGQGPCHVPVKFMLRNHSYTHTVCYTLNLKGKTFSSSNLIPPPYFGRLTFRGCIEPAQSVTVQPRLWITRPGAYGLDSWTLETEVCLPVLGETSKALRKRRYRQEAPAGDESGSCLVVSDTRTT